ncbi:hypothetical protein VQ7734_01971 [Vibrio quintilis]|uniref:Uncharacterized protein n=1 Tax=Vibrio quintilis TaxID=1117707 RepID=A0A1M7YUC2_9VIBR|nr:hypothetical protein VQ7734_01971 [Vibrio quintilis]
MRLQVAWIYVIWVSEIYVKMFQDTQTAGKQFFPVV